MTDLNNKYDVIVIGAGISGLSAAETLTEKGYSVLILYASDVPGGSIRTFRDKYVRIPLGPLFSDPQSPLMPLLKKSHTKLIPLKGLPSAPSAIVEAEYDAANRIIQEAKRIYGIKAVAPLSLSKLLDYTKDNIPKPGTPEFTTRQRIAAMVEHHTGATLEEVTLSELMFDNATEETLCVTDGYQGCIDLLVKKILATKKGHLQFNSPVTNIQVFENHVEVNTHKQTYSATAAVCALPLSVLQQNNITFLPSLSDAKKAALHHLKVGSHSRVALVFEKAFWEENADFLYPGSNDIDTFPEYFNFSRFSKNPFPILICDYYAKETHFKNKTDKEIVKSTLEPLQKAYGKGVTPLKSYFVARNEEAIFSSGKIYGGPGFTEADLEILSLPEGLLFLAGDYLALREKGMVAGAYVSGTIAANHVIALLEQLRPKTAARKPKW